MVIQTALFFVLGFLCAGFLALLVAPAIWRRAVAITRRRMEASLPLSMEEIRADKDRLRAEFALSTRRLEMSVKSLKEKAAVQAVELDSSRMEAKRIAEERDEKDRVIAALETSAEELRTELRKRQDETEALSGRLAEHEKLLDERAQELEKLGRMYDEASFDASSRQIQMVAQDSKLDKLAEDVSILRNERKEAERRAREAAAETRAVRETLREEQKKVAALEKKAEQLTTSLSDSEEKLERRERELARLRERLRGAGDGRDPGGDEDAARGRLEERLTVLTRENRRLRDQLRGGDGSGEQRENAVLREQIKDLAAEVVHLTAMLDGPDSPISKAIAALPPANGQGGERGAASLAERIRALRKEADAPR